MTIPKATARALYGLPPMLEATVPRWIAHWRHRSPEEREARAFELLETADVLRVGRSGAGCDALAESLALLSFMPGGSRFCGLRWVGKEHSS